MPVRFLLWVCAGFVLGGCVPGLLRSDAELAQAIAEPARLQLRLRAATPFVLTTRERFDRPGEDLNVYLEGDGFAWASRTEPSRDPTPDNPLALALAARDPAANVVWIARPCQYTPRQDNPACRDFYWTVGRLAPEVVRAVDVAVSAAKLAAGAKRIHLVGYSGGGGLATAMLPPAGKDERSFRPIIVGQKNSDPYVKNGEDIKALGRHYGLALDPARCFPYRRG